MVALSGVYVAQGRLDEALSTLDAATERAPSERHAVALGRAELCLAVGHREGAIQALEAEAVADVRLEEPLELLHRELVEATAGLNGSRSSERLASVVERTRSLGVTGLRLSAETELGLALLAEGKAEAAIELGRRVHAEATQHWLRIAQARSELLLASAYESTGDHQAAKEHATSAIELAELLGARLIEVEAYRLMGRIEPSGNYIHRAEGLIEGLASNSAKDLTQFLQPDR